MCIVLDDEAVKASQVESPRELHSTSKLVVETCCGFPADTRSTASTERYRN